MHSPVPDPGDRIGADTATVRAELARAEAKATALLGIAGAALTVVLAAQAVHRLPLPAVVVGGLAAVTNAAAIGVLAWVLKPDLGDGTGGWLGYAGLTAEQVRARAAGDGSTDDAEQLAFLAELACRKYVHIRAAVILLLVVVVLVLAGAGLAVALGVR